MQRLVAFSFKPLAGDGWPRAGERQLAGVPVNSRSWSSRATDQVSALGRYAARASVERPRGPDETGVVFSTPCLALPATQRPALLDEEAHQHPRLRLHVRARPAGRGKTGERLAKHGRSDGTNEPSASYRGGDAMTRGMAG